jgi:hypothetical protein
MPEGTGPLRDLHPQILRRGAGAGEFNSLQGQREACEPRTRRLGVPVSRLQRWRLLRRDHGSARSATAARRHHRGRRIRDKIRGIVADLIIGGAVLEYRPTETLPLLGAMLPGFARLCRRCRPARPPKWRKTRVVPRTQAKSGERRTVCWREVVWTPSAGQERFWLRTVMPVAGLCPACSRGRWPLALMDCPPPEAPIWISRFDAHPLAAGLPR